MLHGGKRLIRLNLTYRTAQKSLWHNGSSITEVVLTDSLLSIDRETEEISTSYIREELTRILEHPAFRQSERSSKLLRYLVKTSLAADAAPLKERTIGYEVFNRAAGYDTYSDPVVRNAASDLRKRLRQYYHETTRPYLRMELPNGRYLMEFHPVEAELTLPDTGSSEIPFPITVDDTPIVPPIASAETAMASSPKLPFRMAYLASAASILIVLIGFAYVSHRYANRNIFWDAALNNSGPILVSVGVNKQAEALHPGLHMFTLANMIAYSKVATLLNRHKRSFEMKPDMETNLEDLRHGTAILIGRPSNIWATRLFPRMRYQFGRDEPSKTNYIYDTEHPQVRWEVPQGTINGEDYALVISATSPVTGERVILIGGMGGHATATAAEFVSDDRYRSTLNNLLRDPKHPNIEVVLKAPVVGGIAGSPSIITTHTW